MIKKRKLITMFDVANQANVSVATVSRVINTPHLASYRAQIKVNSAIERLNYDTTVLIKPYQSSTTHKKILVIDNQLISRSLINSGIENMAKSQGYKLLYLRFLYFTQLEIQQIISYTINHQVDGIIFINNSPYLDEIQKFTLALPPMVVLNHFSLQLPCVYFDHLTIAFNATEYLLQQGHSKIACLTGTPDKQSSLYTQQGYTKALQRANITLNANYMIPACFDFATGSGVLKNLMSHTQPPTALICSDNHCLNYSDEELFSPERLQTLHSSENSPIHGIIAQSTKMNIAIPNKLSIIYMAHTAQTKNPPLSLLTHVNKPFYTMGQQGFSLLMQHIARTKPIPKSQLIEAELIVRHSVQHKNL